MVQVSRLLQYSPVRRYSALQALTHPFFDELRDQSVTLPNGVALSSRRLATACTHVWQRLIARHGSLCCGAVHVRVSVRQGMRQLS